MTKVKICDLLTDFQCEEISVQKRKSYFVNRSRDVLCSGLVPSHPERSR